MSRNAHGGRQLSGTQIYICVQPIMGCTRKAGMDMGEDKNIIVEFWDFLKERKAWWLLPLLLLLAIASVLVVFAQSSAISTFTYAFL